MSVRILPRNPHVPVVLAALLALSCAGSPSQSGGAGPGDAGSDGAADAEAGADTGGPDQDGGPTTDAEPDAEAGDAAGDAAEGGGDAADGGGDAGNCALGDALDEFGVDDDCDGADGEAATTIYVSESGSGSNPGTWQQPVQTLQQALVVARSSSGFTSVVIAQSSTPYDGRALGALMSLGLTIVGGYDGTSWDRAQGYATPPSATVLEVARTGETIAGPAAGSGIAVPRGTLSDLEVRVNDAFSIPAGYRDSVVLAVADAPEVTLTRLVLVATDGRAVTDVLAAGLPGADGGPGGDGTWGFDTGLATGGLAGSAPCAGVSEGGGSGQRSSLENNFTGDQNYFVRSNSSGAGQPFGYRGLNASVIFSSSNGNLVGIAPGTPAEGGAGDGTLAAAVTAGREAAGRSGAGAGAAPPLMLSAAGLIVHAAPTAPEIGRTGGGGGGGLSCGSWISNFYGGGGGGAGGCGGLAGTSGAAGGSSVGLIITGAAPIVDTVTIDLGNGADGQGASPGGDGGDGGRGGAATGTSSSCPYGTDPNSNPPITEPGTGGATGGGGGAAGGGGGGGTGGNGGVSAGVLVKGSALPTGRLLAITVTLGTAGAAGSGAPGGASGAPGAGGSGAPAGTSNAGGGAGSDGNAGSAADMMVVP